MTLREQAARSWITYKTSLDIVSDLREKGKISDKEMRIAAAAEKVARAQLEELDAIARKTNVNDTEAYGTWKTYYDIFEKSISELTNLIFTIKARKDPP